MEKLTHGVWENTECQRQRKSILITFFWYYLKMKITLRDVPAGTLLN